MYSMDSGDGFGASFVSKIYRLEQFDWFTFAITGTLTAGEVTVQFSPDRTEALAGNWSTLDATNLVLTEPGNRITRWSECYVRAIGDGSITGSPELWIGGKNVYPLTKEEQDDFGVSYPPNS